jgi:hypothetical protein
MAEVLNISVREILPLDGNNVLGSRSGQMEVKTLFQYFFISKMDIMAKVPLCGIPVVRRGGHEAIKHRF